MKRFVFSAMVVVAILLAPSISMAADGGPTAVSKSNAEAKADVAAPASVPTSAPTSAPVKPEIKIEGKVEVPKAHTDDAAVIDMVVGIYTSFKEGRVWDRVSLLLMLLTFIVGLMKKDIPPKYLPWIAASIGIATNIVSAIIGGVEWGHALLTGFFQGAAAAGLWSMVGKYVLRSKEERTKRSNARELASSGIVSGKTGK
jgi:hypothetical protein